jgi:hypothetical protein
MIKLDDDLLQELGLAALPPEEKKKLLAHIYETLEMRVGMKLAEQMSDAQLTEFEQFIDRNDEAGALRWLESNFPNYKDVVAAEFENLKREIGQVAPQILAASNAQASAMQQPGAPMPQQMPQQQQPQPGMGMPPQPQHMQQPQQMPPMGPQQPMPGHMGQMPPMQPPQMPPQPPQYNPNDYNQAA